MSDAATRPPATKRLADFGAGVPTLALLTPFVSFLKFQEYPLLSAEALYLAGWIAALGVALGAMVRWGGRIGASLVITAAVLVFVDFQFEIRLTYLAAGGAVVVVAGWFFVRAAMPVLAVAAAVVFISTLVLPPQLRQPDVVLASAADVRPELSPVIHVILDEQIGVEGIETDTPWERKAREDLKAFYLNSGFRLFGAAYSNYGETFDSIPNLLNGSLTLKRHSYVETGADGLPALKKNAYLKRLSGLGYRVRVYQSKYFNYCEAEGVSLLSCASYNYTGLGNLNALSDDPLVRAELVLARFLNRSRIYGLARSLYQRAAVTGFLKLRRIENNNFAPLASYPFFERIERDIAAGVRGQVLFAHLLIPHRPFMFDANCNLVLDHSYDEMEHGSPEWLAAYRRAYYEQVACTTRRMKGLFDALRQAGIYDSATIIVHGDHGSRITPRPIRTSTWDSFSLADRRAYFSTLFAIKRPGLPGGYDDRLISLARLVGAAATSIGGAFAPIPDEVRTVVVPADDEKTMEKRPLPDFRVQTRPDGSAGPRGD